MRTVIEDTYFLEKKDQVKVGDNILLFNISINVEWIYLYFLLCTFMQSCHID